MITAINRKLSTIHSGHSGQMSGDGEPANWTSYNAGEPISDRVLQAAENPSTPAETLSMLADSCNVEVRMAVADNGSASLETILMLAQDESADLRYQLAENHNIHESVLKLLAEDAHPYVAQRAQKTLKRLAAGAVILMYPGHGVAPLVGIGSQSF